jgi:uncharacterized membrane protein YhdT
MSESAMKQGRGIGGVSRHTSVWLAWALCALSLVLTALSLLLLILNLSYPNAHLYEPWLDNTLTAISYAPVGALIASRHPENPVGWLLCLYGFVISLSYFSAEYAIYALLAQPDSLPAGEAMAWVFSWMLPLVIGFSTLSYLLFPTGRLPSRRWRWAVWLTVAFIVVGVLLGAFSSGPLSDLGPIQNPLGIVSLADIYSAILYTTFSVLLVAVISSVFVRLRRAGGVEHQQIKWFAYAVAANAIAVVVAYVIPGLIETPLWFERVGFALNNIVIPAIPIAIGIAILRYRLYDIDLLINRTLVYGSLTLMLALVYFGGVTATQAVFTALTGQEQQPQLAIVISTLVIAALFTPLRRRIQSFIDRSFYRRKYDARKTLEALSAKLRDETDLEALSVDLVGAVRETMQPAHVSLWLRPDPKQRDKRRAAIREAGHDE